MAGDNGHPTFIGPGFGTLLAQYSANEHNGVPPVVSQRETLRRGMPSIYHDTELDPTDFAMRLVGALEVVLDPIVAVLDSLTAQFSPDYAPSLTLDMLAAWLGIELDESQDLDARREHVRMASELGRWRGTVRGLELALNLSFPATPMRVKDDGGVRWSLDGARAEVDPPRFVVYVDEPVPAERQLEIARCIERHKPVEASYRLRVRASKGAGG